MQIRRVILNLENNNTIKIDIKHPNLYIKQLDTDVISYNKQDTSRHLPDFITNQLYIKIYDFAKLNLRYTYGKTNNIVKHSSISLDLTYSNNQTAFDNIVSIQLADKQIMKFSDFIALFQLSYQHSNKNSTELFGKQYPLIQRKTYDFMISIYKQANSKTVSFYLQSK